MLKFRHPPPYHGTVNVNVKKNIFLAGACYYYWSYYWTLQYIVRLLPHNNNTSVMDAAELEMTRAHDAARKFTESKIAQLSKPKLGQKPLTPEQIEAQAAVLRSALRTKHAAEVEALRVRLAAVVVAAAAAASVPTDSIPPGDAPHGESLATPETTPSCETSSATQSAPITSSDQQQQQPRQEASPLPTPSLITAPASTNLKTVAATVAISAAAAVSAADAGGPKKSRAKRREVCVRASFITL